MNKYISKDCYRVRLQILRLHYQCNIDHSIVKQSVLYRANNDAGIVCEASLRKISEELVQQSLFTRGYLFLCLSLCEYKTGNEAIFQNQHI